MARFEDKAKAITLRKQEMSYSQIKQILGVSKSTLSGWLSGMPLSSERILELRACSDLRVERFRETMRQKRESRRELVFLREQNKLLPLSNKELYIAGLFLYWGEGGKTAKFQITMTNSDPSMMVFYVRWLRECLDVPVEKIKAKLHVYSDMNYLREMNYWASLLGLKEEQFRKPFIKPSTLRGLTYKTFGHGTCNLIVYSRDLYEQVMMGIQATCGKFVGLE